MANAFIDGLYTTSAKVFLMKTGQVKDLTNENNFHPNANVNGLFVHIEDGVSTNIVTINFAPSKKPNWATHDFPLLYIDTIEHTIIGELTPRTFARYFNYMPSQLLSMNLNSSSIMDVGVTVKQQSGANLLGAFNTLADLQSEYNNQEVLMGFDEDNTIAYVYEVNSNGYYMVDYVGGSYQWVLKTNSYATYLSTKPYNMFTIKVQRGYQNTKPITPLEDEQYRLLWAYMGSFAGLIEAIGNRVTTLEEEMDVAQADIIDLQDQIDKVVDGTTDIAFDKTGTNLNSDFVEEAIKEVNTKSDANAQNIADMKDGTDAFSEITLGTPPNVVTIRYIHTNGNNFQVVGILYPDGREANIDEEMYVNFRNESGGTRDSGIFLMTDGLSTGNQAVKGILFNPTSQHARKFLGVVTVDGVGVNQKSKATRFGIVHGIPTTRFRVTGTAYAEGQYLWATADGLLSNVAPAKPALQINVGIIINLQGGNADILVCPIVYGAFGDSSDVIITTPTNGDIPILGSDGIWRNSQRLVTAEADIDNLQDEIILKADKTYVDAQDQALDDYFENEITNIKDGTTIIKKAEQDKNGNDIVATYETKSVVSGINGRVTNLETANMIKSYTYNSSTHVLTFTYYDNTTTSFDLPLESAIVDASYDNVTKDITFTLQSGATLVVPLDDLISGLASETWVTTYFIPKTALKTSFSATPLDTNVISEKLAKDTFDTKEALANKKSVINDSVTEYPNSKAVKDGLALKAEKYQVAHFERIKLESDTQTHSSGYRYTSFGGGVTFAGKELYAQHSASGHVTTSDPSTWGVIVLYTRQDDGSFTSQVLDIDYETLDGGVRDVNLSVSPNGKYLYMKFFTNAGVVGQYGAYLCVYNQSMTLLKRIQLFTATDYVVWGNTLQSPDGYLLTTAYRALNSTKQLAIYRSTTPVADDFNSVSFSVVTTLRATGNLFVTEANIAYWQNKLVLFTRVDEQPSMYSETNDLNGGKNWTPLVSCGSQIHAPAFPQYIYEPYLFVSGSLRFSSTLRKLAVLTLSPSGVWSAPVILDNDMVAYSGYNSFVRNRYGFGVMYFEGAVEASGTNLYFKDVDLVRYLPQISSYELDGNVTKIELNEIGLDTPLNDLSGKSLRQIFELSNQILNGSFTNDFESWTGVNNFNSVSTTDYVLPPKSAQQTNELQARYQDITALTTDTLYVAGYLKKNGGGSGAKMVIYDRNSFANATNLTNNTNAWVRSSWRGSKNNGVRIMIGHYSDNIACDNRYDDIVVINQNTAGISTVSQATLDYWYNVYIEIKLKSTMQYILEKLKTLTV